MTAHSGFARLGIFLVLATVVACSSDKGGPTNNESAHEKKAKALARGYKNANAMVENAKLCEPEEGIPSIEACERACNLNHSNSCANWAALLEGQDPARALSLYQRACKGGSGIGCEGQAFHVEHSGKDASAIYRNARRYHRIHCSQGYARSCHQLATMFETTKGGKALPETAKSFRKQACVLGRKASCL